MTSYSESIRRELGEKAMKGHASRVELYEVVDVLVEAIGELRQQIKALEEADSYKGTWQRALSYRKGAQVTHKGGLWVALVECDAGLQPGENPAHWQLAAKGKQNG